MVGFLLDDAFNHHVWATIRLIDACAELDPARLEPSVPGTYGSILNTQPRRVRCELPVRAER
jgi:hypothetical protein